MPGCRFDFATVEHFSFRLILSLPGLIGRFSIHNRVFTRSPSQARRQQASWFDAPCAPEERCFVENRIEPKYSVSAALCNAEGLQTGVNQGVGGAPYGPEKGKISLNYRRSTTMPRRFACGIKQTSGMFGGSQD